MLGEGWSRTASRLAGSAAGSALGRRPGGTVGAVTGQSGVGARELGQRVVGGWVA